MGLYDRDYMREDSGPRRRRRRRLPWSPTVVLIAALVVVFIVQLALHWRGSGWLEFHAGLSLDGLRRGWVWQLATFQFLHGGFLHILLNSVTLYSFGRFLETELGRGRFLGLYFLSGVAGGVLQVAAVWALGQDPEVPVVGASAGIMGLLGAFILSHPELRLTLFPIPVPVRARTLLWFILPVSIIGTVYPFWGIAHAAHLGGLLAGGAFIRWTWRQPRHEPPILATTDLPPEPEASADNFIESQVNPILDKIASQGIHSLTEQERRILEEARHRMDGR